MGTDHVKPQEPMALEELDSCAEEPTNEVVAMESRDASEHGECSRDNVEADASVPDNADMYIAHATSEGQT